MDGWRLPPGFQKAGFQNRTFTDSLETDKRFEVYFAFPFISLNKKILIASFLLTHSC